MVLGGLEEVSVCEGFCDGVALWARGLDVLDQSADGLAELVVDHIVRARFQRRVRRLVVGLVRVVELDRLVASVAFHPKIRLFRFKISDFSKNHF